MKLLITIIIAATLFGCIQGATQVYNTIEPRNIVILDKRYVPGFTSPDKYMLKVREGNEYRWLNTTAKHYASMHVGDTLKTVLCYDKI